jgi:radical SAM superfamily enzyme YgiQ (UPF0313 family)
MNRRVLFCVPPTGLYLRQDRCQTFLEDRSAMEPPNELAYMAAQMKRAGFECRIEDYPMLPGGWRRLERDLSSFNPGLLVIAPTAPTLSDDLRAARRAKELLRGAVTAVKAAWMTPGEAGQLVDTHPEIDIVFLAEYETSALEVGRALSAGKPLSGVKGLVVREKGKARHTGPRPRLKDPDGLPFPARELVRNRLYVRPDTGRPRATIQAARGCGYDCAFCLAGTVEGRRVRERDPEKIVDEMQECVVRFGIRDFFLRADTFTLHKGWVIRLCKSILSRKLKVSWVCNSRVDTLDEERLEWMKKAGCWLVSLGVESGSQAILDRISKGTRLADAVRTVRLCRRFGVKTYCFYILGFPWDDEKTIGETVDFAKKLNGDYFLFHLLMPFPGTRIYEAVASQGLFRSGSVTGFDHSRAAMGTLHLSADGLDRLWKRANWSMYLHPPYLLRLVRGMVSLAYVFNYLRYGLSKLLYLVFHRPRPAQDRKQ